MRRPGAVALACFLLGCALMVPFEATVTRVLGVMLLFAAVVIGVFAIATPDLLSAERDAED
jgi:hypothetical protein